MIRSRTKINTSSRTRREFVRRSRRCVRITQTSKDTKVIILREEAKEDLKGCLKR